MGKSPQRMKVMIGKTSQMRININTSKYIEISKKASYSVKGTTKETSHNNRNHHI